MTIVTRGNPGESKVKPTILTSSDIQRVPSKLRPIKQSGLERMGCPYHGSDNQRSLVIKPDGSWRCFSCGEWGFTEERDRVYQEQYKQDKQYKRYKPYKQDKGYKIPRMTAGEALCRPLEVLTISRLRRWQDALVGANSYLQQRSISYELAKEYGLGFKEKGNPFYNSEKNQPVGWQDEKIIAPHTNPSGAVVNIYARSMDGENRYKHLHLPCPKGHFNAKAFKEKGSPLYVCEGVFDALSLISTGINRSIAVFGLSGFRWDWVEEHEREIVLALDQDVSGQAALNEFTEQATLRGIKVYRVTADELGGKNDVNEALVAGCLKLENNQEESKIDFDILPDPKINLPEMTIELPPEYDIDLVELPGIDVETLLKYKEVLVDFRDQYAREAKAFGYTAKELFSLPERKGLQDGSGILWTVAKDRYMDLVFTFEGVFIKKSDRVTHNLDRSLIRPSGKGYKVK
jgi:hypothetical protein